MTFIKDYGIIIIERESEIFKMKNKELKAYHQKVSVEDLQMYLHFRKRGGKVAAKKGKGSYDRKDFKKGVA